MVLKVLRRIKALSCCLPHELGSSSLRDCSPTRANDKMLYRNWNEQFMCKEMHSSNYSTCSRSMKPLDLLLVYNQSSIQVVTRVVKQLTAQDKCWDVC